MQYVLAHATRVGFHVPWLLGNRSLHSEACRNPHLLRAASGRTRAACVPGGRAPPPAPHAGHSLHPAQVADGGRGAWTSMFRIPNGVDPATTNPAATAGCTLASTRAGWITCGAPVIWKAWLPGSCDTVDAASQGTTSMSVWVAARSALRPMQCRCVDAGAMPPVLVKQRPSYCRYHNSPS